MLMVAVSGCGCLVTEVRVFWVSSLAVLESSVVTELSGELFRPPSLLVGCGSRVGDNYYCLCEGNVDVGHEVINCRE